MKNSNTKANIGQLKDQAIFIKRVMGVNKGRQAHSNLKEEVIRISENLQTHTPDEQNHRLLNIYIASYLEKLSLRKPEEAIAPEIIPADFLLVDYH